ncbi:COX15/CtaA family protein [Vibrio barjaei]|uniref:COX15/CtaA family protein n=1 Tax=Vibrio barjaei TaxID=1676683 RepID=UPI002283CA33|nr:COX15/CtaA family protein [Vibrio barjaei]MCY9870963.1 COX15/CtaA family protein [Vibrio barjaei]
MRLIDLVKGALVLTVIVIAMGAYTRLADAGLGCPDWPGCYGHLTVPSNNVDVAVANTLFPERAVEPHKAWLEMIHRYLAGTLGLVVFAMTYLALRNERARLGVTLPVSLSLVIVFQAALGMWTVTLKLMPIVVMGHLIGGFTMFSLLFFTYLKLRPSVTATRRDNKAKSQSEASTTFQPTVVEAKTVTSERKIIGRRLKLLAGLALVATILQIILGGWVSSNYAAVVCTALPICEGEWVRYLDFKTAFTPVHSGFDNYEFGVLDYAARMTIHVSHRFGAIVVTLLVGILGLNLLQHKQRVVRNVAVLLLGLLAIQLALGVSNVVFHLPLPIAVMHNLGAALLLLSLIQANYILWNIRYAQSEKPTLTVIESENKVERLKVSGDKESSL